MPQSSDESRLAASLLPCPSSVHPCLLYPGVQAQSPQRSPGAVGLLTYRFELFPSRGNQSLRPPPQQYFFNRRAIRNTTTQIATGPAFLILICHQEHLLGWAQDCLDPVCTCSVSWEIFSFLLPIVSLLYCFLFVWSVVGFLQSSELHSIAACFVPQLVTASWKPPRASN